MKRDNDDNDPLDQGFDIPPPSRRMFLTVLVLKWALYALMAIVLGLMLLEALRR